MPKLKKDKPACAACGGTGRNTKGGFCDPCLQNAHIDTELMLLDRSQVRRDFEEYEHQHQPIAPQRKAVEF